ncbi:MAG: hypothetical protein ABH821_05100 [archaeon]
MKRMIYFRLGSKNVHLPKLVGAFVFIAAVLFFLVSGAAMFETWDNIKETKECLSANVNDPIQFNQCKDNALDSLGIHIRSDQRTLSFEQYSMALLKPIAFWLLWIAGVLIGLIIYQSGKMMIPIEQTIRELPSRKRILIRRKKRR